MPSNKLEEVNPDYIFKGDAHIFKQAARPTSRCSDRMSSNMEPIGKSFRQNTNTTYKQNEVSKAERYAKQHEVGLLSMLGPPC